MPTTMSEMWCAPRYRRANDTSSGARMHNVMTTRRTTTLEMRVAINANET